MVKSDGDIAMERWATKHGELSTDDKKNYTREEQTSGLFLKSFTRKILSVMKKSQPEQVQKQMARKEAWATYLEEQREAERVFVEMKMRPNTRLLEVDGDERIVAVEKIHDKWKTMQIEHGDA